jgi:hypothetical protein
MNSQSIGMNNIEMSLHPIHNYWQIDEYNYVKTDGSCYFDY